METKIQTPFLSYRLPSQAAGTPIAILPLAAAGAPDARYATLARELDEAKTKLDRIPEHTFNRFMRSIDMYTGLKWTLQKSFNLQLATNATLKMYELIVEFGLIQPGAPCRVFCNAELPGAFIVAINHYMKTHCPATPFDWVASSFLPTEGSTLLDDTYKIYALNRDRWLMGPRPCALPAPYEPISGDVTDVSSVICTAAAVHHRYGAGAADPEAPGEGSLVPAVLGAVAVAGRGKMSAGSGATLYTSDVGIDVSSNFNRQEELTAAVNYGQVLSGLLSLAPGGSMVTKQYTFFTEFSRSLLALLTMLFDDVVVAKPCTSRPVNSEVYVVARGFRGTAPELRAALFARLLAYREGRAPCDHSPLVAVPAAVDEAIFVAASGIHGAQQVACLREAMRFYHSAAIPVITRAMQPHHQSATRRWLQRMAPMRIASADWIPMAKKE